MEELIENTMDLMAEDNPDIEQIIKNLRILQENNYFSDLSKIRLIFFEIASELENEQIDKLLNECTNNNYSYFNDFLRNNEYSLLDFTYKIAKTDALEFYLTSPEINRKYHSKQYKIFKMNEDFLEKYPVKDFAYLFLNYHLENFTGLTDEEKEFCEKFKNIAEIHKRKYENQCRDEFMEMAKEKFKDYFTDKKEDILNQVFIRMYREKDQALVQPRKIKSCNVGGKPHLESGTWASTSPINKKYISKWDEWQKSEMDINYNFVSTFTIDKSCNLLSVNNINELAVLYFLYPYCPINFENMLDLFNCADEKIKYSFASYQIDWEKVFSDYNVFHFANNDAIGEGFEMSNPYDAETILIRDICLIKDLKEYEIDEYRRIFCIENIER